MSRRGRALAAAADHSMRKWDAIATHAAMASVFIILLQRLAPIAALETSLLCALALAGGAAGLALRQAHR